MNDRDANLFINRLKAPIDLEWIEERLAEAAYCVNTRIRGDQLRAIVDLAMRSRGFNVSGLDRLRNASNQKEVELTGCQIRLLLMLARQALRWKLRPKLRLVHSNEHKIQLRR